MLGITLIQTIDVVFNLAQGKVEMHGKLLLRISAVTAYFIVDATAVSCMQVNYYLSRVYLVKH